MRIKTEQWLKALIAAFVSGVAQSFLTVCGIQGANMVGVQIHQLERSQLLFTTLFGGIAGAMLYLKQSPVPPDDTIFMTKPDSTDKPTDKQP